MASGREAIADGVFRLGNAEDNIPVRYSPACDENESCYGIVFDASRSSSVYKDGVTEVTPPNMSLNYIIKL